MIKMTVFDEAWRVLKEDTQPTNTRYDEDVGSDTAFPFDREMLLGPNKDDMHAPGTCPVCDKKRAMADRASIAEEIGEPESDLPIVQGDPEQLAIENQSLSPKGTNIDEVNRKNVTVPNYLKYGN